ncbi:MAG: primosomal protein N' [Bacillus thermozeamaize]|uniref:Replication restart protein PriA n=1 Tax=Bacillus thermozeamaize TaxID=230954 RepID=A0A1Y3PK43_9BACI|nr:MAG: primosomal protein N' [Bacillus thermozeamaize]
MRLRVQVVVDVPGQAGDQSYTYLVPEEWAAEVRIGSRVVVPFGSRRVDGIVIDVKDEPLAAKRGTEQAQEDIVLREIEEVVPPPLTAELVNLAHWLSQKTLCSWMTALKVMIPAGVRGRYTTEVEIKDDGWLKTDEEQEILSYVKDHPAIAWKDLLQAFPAYKRILNQWRREGRLVVRPVLKRDVRGKKAAFIRLNIDPGKLDVFLQQLPRQAVKQREILEQFRRHPDEEWLQSDLLKRVQASSSTIQSLIRQGVLARVEKEVPRHPFSGRPPERDVPKPLTEEQQSVLNPILAAISKREYQAFLLHGVTGSGKTEVYLQAIAHCRHLGRAAIVLVPEISLTPQMVDRFRRRFGEEVAVFHSGLSQGERFDEWRRIQEGRAGVVVGARSAIFSPFENIGLIIVDEEHEGTYKQEEAPRYHARDVALRRARYHRAAVVFGSATPSLEAYTAALQGGFTLLSMRHRVHGRPYPRVHLVDLRKELQEGNRSLFSRLLYEKMLERFARKEQVILFQHRRGFAHFVMCRVCGTAITCPHCDITLTYHRVGNHLRCHYCGFTALEPSACPECGSQHIRHLGVGTQRVEEELNRLFPQVRVLRMDADTTAQKGAHQRLLDLFQRHEADVLLGTQMITKGLDFPNVTLVGVILADSLLFLPDFRASERTFQLLTQVSGRAGRHERPGEVVIQSFNPEHESIQAAATHDYVRFYQREMLLRKQSGYPPYCRLAQLVFAHETAAVALSWATQVTHWLNGELKDHAHILGPVASPIARLKNRYRFQSMIKYTNETIVRTVLRAALTHWEPRLKKEQVSWHIDMEPRMLG